MNKDKIFNLFEDNNEEGKELTLDILHEDPYFKLGMFSRIILNHFVFHEKLEKFLKKENPNYDVSRTQEASSFVVFNRAWSYLKDINPENKKDWFAIVNYEGISLSKALESALEYFVELEEYEKCAHIFKIQTILKERKE